MPLEKCRPDAVNAMARRAATDITDHLTSRSHLASPRELHHLVQKISEPIMYEHHVHPYYVRLTKDHLAHHAGTDTFHKAYINHIAKSPLPDSQHSFWYNFFNRIGHAMGGKG